MLARQEARADSASPQQFVTFIVRTTVPALGAASDRRDAAICQLLWRIYTIDEMIPVDSLDVLLTELRRVMDETAALAGCCDLARACIQIALVGRLAVAALMDDRIARVRLLRLVAESGSIDADKIAARVCASEAYLLDDPSRTYPHMDSESQSVYRRCVADIALAGGVTPSSVAQRAQVLASRGESDMERHIGYYLMDAGVAQMDPRDRREPAFGFDRSKITAYYGILRCSLAAGLASLAVALSPLPGLGTLLLAMAIFVVALDAAGAPVERYMLRAVKRPEPPLIDFRQSGLPPSAMTVIAMPTLVVNDGHAGRVLANLERNFLTANDSRVRAVLLTDFVDTPAEGDTDEERSILAAYVKGIEALNRKYARWTDQAFYLLHRSRTYCTTQRAWIGWERKRGKLHDLNQLMLGRSSSFSLTCGNSDDLVGARYVLVVDEDSYLGKDGLHYLVGALEHPLNRPDVVDGRVRRGHCLAVPHTPTAREAVQGWPLAHLVGGHICDETTASNRVVTFQFNILGQAHYPGKGLYDVQAFDAACAGKIPSERILSHDTIEGIFTKPAFVGQARIYDGFPQSLSSYFIRCHRWLRGDWQNVCFALSRLDAETPPLAGKILLLNQFISGLAQIGFGAGLMLIVGMNGGGWMLGLLLVAALLPLLDRLARELSLLRPIRSWPGRLWEVIRTTLEFGVFRCVTGPMVSVLYLHAYACAISAVATRRGLMAWVSAAVVDRSRHVGLPTLIGALIALLAVVLDGYFWMRHANSPVRDLLCCLAVIAPVALAIMKRADAT